MLDIPLQTALDSVVDDVAASDENGAAVVVDGGGYRPFIVNDLPSNGLKYCIKDA